MSEREVPATTPTSPTKKESSAGARDDAPTGGAVERDEAQGPWWQHAATATEEEARGAKDVFARGFILCTDVISGRGPCCFAIEWLQVRCDGVVPDPDAALVGYHPIAFESPMSGYGWPSPGRCRRNAEWNRSRRARNPLGYMGNAAVIRRNALEGVANLRERKGRRRMAKRPAPASSADAADPLARTSAPAGDSGCAQSVGSAAGSATACDGHSPSVSPSHAPRDAGSRRRGSCDTDGPQLVAASPSIGRRATQSQREGTDKKGGGKGPNPWIVTNDARVPLLGRWGYYRTADLGHRIEGFYERYRQNALFGLVDLCVGRPWDHSGYDARTFGASEAAKGARGKDGRTGCGATLTLQPPPPPPSVPRREAVVHDVDTYPGDCNDDARRATPKHGARKPVAKVDGQRGSPALATIPPELFGTAPSVPCTVPKASPVPSRCAPRIQRSDLSVAREADDNRPLHDVDGAQTDAATMFGSCFVIDGQLRDQVRVRLIRRHCENDPTEQRNLLEVLAIEDGDSAKSRHIALPSLRQMMLIGVARRRWSQLPREGAHNEDRACHLFWERRAAAAARRSGRRVPADRPAAHGTKRATRSDLAGRQPKRTKRDPPKGACPIPATGHETKRDKKEQREKANAGSLRGRRRRRHQYDDSEDEDDSDDDDYHGYGGRRVVITDIRKAVPMAEWTPELVRDYLMRPMRTRDTASDPVAYEIVRSRRPPSTARVGVAPSDAYLVRWSPLTREERARGTLPDGEPPPVLDPPVYAWVGAPLLPPNGDYAALVRAFEDHVSHRLRGALRAFWCRVAGRLARTADAPGAVASRRTRRYVCIQLQARIDRELHRAGLRKWYTAVAGVRPPGRLVDHVPSPAVPAFWQILHSVSTLALQDERAAFRQRLLNAAAEKHDELYGNDVMGSFSVYRMVVVQQRLGPEKTDLSVPRDGEPKFETLWREYRAAIGAPADRPLTETVLQRLAAAERDGGGGADLLPRIGHDEGDDDTDGAEGKGGKDAVGDLMRDVNEMARDRYDGDRIVLLDKARPAALDDADWTSRDDADAARGDPLPDAHQARDLVERCYASWLRHERLAVPCHVMEARPPHRDPAWPWPGGDATDTVRTIQLADRRPGQRGRSGGRSDARRHSPATAYDRGELSERISGLGAESLYESLATREGRPLPDGVRPAPVESDAVSITATRTDTVAPWPDETDRDARHRPSSSRSPPSADLPPSGRARLFVQDHDCGSDSDFDADDAHATRHRSAQRTAGRLSVPQSRVHRILRVPLTPTTAEPKEESPSDYRIDEYGFKRYRMAPAFDRREIEAITRESNRRLMREAMDVDGWSPDRLRSVLGSHCDDSLLDEVLQGYSDGNDDDDASQNHGDDGDDGENDGSFCHASGCGRIVGRPASGVGVGANRPRRNSC